jgi:hypothetical protein
MTAAESESAYAALSAGADLRKSALFARRLPISFRPLDPAHPEHGYVSDDDADRREIWQIDDCSLDEAVEIAVAIFDSPVPSQSLREDFDRLEIARFVKALPDSDRLTLCFVCEDFLEFRYFEKTDAISRSLLSRIVEFKRSNYRYDSGAEQERWQWSAFRKKGSFTVGVA